MLASDVSYRARVCVGPMLGRVSMWVHPLQGIHTKFPRMNAYYDKARYKSLIARENITRWNVARQGCPKVSLEGVLEVVLATPNEVTPDNSWQCALSFCTDCIPSCQGCDLP